MRPFILVISCLFFIQNIAAQKLERHVFSSCGSSYITGNIWLDFTMGEMSVESYTSASIVLNQGFHQVYNIAVNPSKPTEVSVYPNPSVGYLEIDIPDELINLCTYEITDMAGKVISTSESTNTLFPDNNNYLNISDLSGGMYMLNIYVQNSSDTYFFKIIKL